MIIILIETIVCYSQFASPLSGKKQAFSFGRYSLIRNKETM
jgi:hypothetical protein